MFGGSIAFAPATIEGLSLGSFKLYTWNGSVHILENLFVLKFSTTRGSMGL